MAAAPVHETLLKNVAEELLLVLTLSEPGPVVPVQREWLRSVFARIQLVVDLPATNTGQGPHDDDGSA